MSDEPLEQHDAATRGSLHMICIALAHLWLTACYLKIHRLPTKSIRYVYSNDIDWGRNLLEKPGYQKRIKVTIEIEDY